jgi:hypothetical protein
MNSLKLLSDRKNLRERRLVIRLKLYYVRSIIQSVKKQAQKLASQLALKEFRWDEWGSSQSKNRDRSGYWSEKFETDYFNRKERNKQSQTTWDTDYNHNVLVETFLEILPCNLN